MASSGGGSGARKLNLKLRKFDITRINNGNTVVMLGKRKTGKSTIILDILHHNRDIPIGTIISGTEASNRTFSQIIPSMFIHDEYSPMITANLLKRQKLIAGKIEKDLAERGSTSIDPRNFLIMDDMLFDNSWTRDRNMRYLFMNGRHVHTMTVVSLQEPMGLPPAMRTNTDFVFILRENINNNRRKIYEQWAGMFPDYDSFCQVMNQCTENYECLVIDNNSQSNKLEDQVFWYKATMHPPFRMCAPEYWARSAAFNRDRDAGADGEEFDPTTGGARRRFQLNVMRH